MGEQFTVTDESEFGPPIKAKKPSLAKRLVSAARDMGPQTAGGMIGGAMGTPFGPAGRAAGATLGGAGGKAYGMVADYATGRRDPVDDTATGNIKEIGLAGLMEGGGDAGLMGREKAVPPIWRGALALGRGGGGYPPGG